MRRLILSLSILHACGAQAQIVEFPTVEPGAAVRLESGSPVTVDLNGNLLARCDAQSPTGCVAIGTGGSPGGCGGPATFSQGLTVTSPTTPPAPGPYAPGTTLTVGASASGAVVCAPSATVNGNGAGLAGWTNPIVPAAGSISQSVTLPATADATVVLRLTCYGQGGSVTTQRTVNTGAGGGVPSACPTQIPYTSASAGSSTTSPIGGTSVSNINGFETLINVIGFNVNPFPSTGTAGNLIGPSSEVRSIRFSVPSPFPSGSFLRRFQFVSWPNGFNFGNNGYISVSSCPGDLRVPTANQTGTTLDPTYAEACRNWRGNSWAFEDAGQSDIPYVVGVPGQPNLSTSTQCILVPGQVYYLNIFMNKPNRTNRTLFPLTPVCRDPQGTPFNCGHGISAGG